MNNLNGICKQCGGLILDPNKTYGYAGPICYCSYKSFNNQMNELTEMAFKYWKVVEENNDLKKQIEKLQKKVVNLIKKHKK